MDVLLIQN